MTTFADGTSVCDRCGRNIGNAGLDVAVTIADLHPDDPSRVVNHHLCRTAEDSSKGCATRVLTRAALADAHERYDAARAADEKAEQERQAAYDAESAESEDSQ